MLLETKAIIQFALLWGSTWVVASLAIASVLGMALVANFVVARVEIKRPGAVGAVLVGAARPQLRDPDRPHRVREPRAESLFYAVLEFQPDSLRGAALRLGDQALDLGRARLRHEPARRDGGGVAEYMSLVTGFRMLLFVIAACYIGAVIARLAEDRRAVEARPAEAR